jgi:hypothetical protein
MSDRFALWSDGGCSSIFCYFRKSLSARQKLLSCHGQKLLDVGPSGGKERCSEQSTLGQMIAVSRLDLTDESVVAQQTQLATGLGGETPPIFRGSLPGCWMQELPHIAFSEAGGSELAAGDQLQE